MPIHEQLTVHSFVFGTVRFIREATLEGYQHPCTTEDVIASLERLPARDLKGLAFIIFHQPTRKEESASPRWAAYWPEHRRGNISGSSIFLDAVNPAKYQRWKPSLRPADERELATLEREGHTILRSEGEILISLDLESTRRTQLERSLPHELGHHVDFMSDPSGFMQKSRDHKELFAERYLRQLVRR